MEPKRNNPNNLQGAISEIASAMSALHMPHEEMERGDNPDFLVYTSTWVNHAHEHLQQALQYLNLLWIEIDRERIKREER